MSEQKVKKICPHCGGDNIVVDAAARWSVEKQEWVVSCVYDVKAYCCVCADEVREKDEVIQ